MRLQDVILRDTRANQPATSDVAPGTLYYVTDEQETERCSDDGTTWESFSDAAATFNAIEQLTGDVTAGPGPGTVTATIGNDKVTFAKMQNISTGKVLGRGTASTGDPEELTPTSGIETTSTPGIRVTQAARTRQIGITVDGGGSVVTAGIKGYKSFPVAGTVIATRLLADASGSVAFKVTQNVFASYPPTTSVATPSLSGAQSGETTGLSLAVAAGDVFGFEITGSPATITRVTLELTIVVTG